MPTWHLSRGRIQFRLTFPRPILLAGFAGSRLRIHRPCLSSEPARRLAAARTSGLVNLVFSRQTGFSSASIRLVIKSMVIIEPAVPWIIKMARRRYLLEAKHLGLGSKPWQHAARSYSIRAESFSITPKEKLCYQGGEDHVGERPNNSQWFIRDYYYLFRQKIDS